MAFLPGNALDELKNHDLRNAVENITVDFGLAGNVGMGAAIDLFKPPFYLHVAAPFIMDD